MKTHSLLAALSAVVALPAFATMRPVAHWDVVPYQFVKEPFTAGVVAFYDKPFKVEFTVNGRKAGVAEKASVNDRTKVEEYWFTLDPAKINPEKLKENRLRLGAKVVAEDGTSHALPEIVLYWDLNNSLGSKKTIWLDQKDGNDYSDGTKERPVKTMRQAAKLAGDGGTIYLMKPGKYTAERIGGIKVRKYWMTIMPAPGLTRNDIKIKGGRTGCDKLHFKDVQIYSDVANGTAYALGGIDENSSCWIENCIVRDKGGRSAGRSYTFGNKLIGYVTGGETTEMGDGPRGRLMRNHVIKKISGDTFLGSNFLAVNCQVSDVDSTGVMEEPAFHRSQGIQGAWTHDVVIANVTASECACNGLIGLKLRDSVFSNVTLGTTGPAKRYVSRYAWEMENVWFDRVKVAGQEWEWFKATNHSGDFAPTDVRVTGCSFELPPPEEKEN